MTYRIARDGQIYGPYSLREVERHLSTGHIVTADLAQPVGADEWLPVDELFPTAPAPAARTLPGGLTRLYPDPPNLPWWVMVIASVVTLGIFSTLWDVWESLWLRRCERTSVAVYLYAGVALLFFLKLPGTVETVLYNVGLREALPDTAAWPVVATAFVLAIASRFIFRNELLEHFNRTEPIGLRLNGIFTLLFGGIYFQYHFNRINEVKKALRVSVP